MPQGFALSVALGQPFVDLADPLIVQGLVLLARNDALLVVSVTLPGRVGKVFCLLSSAPLQFRRLGEPRPEGGARALDRATKWLLLTLGGSQRLGLGSHPSPCFILTLTCYHGLGHCNLLIGMLECGAGCSVCGLCLLNIKLKGAPLQAICPAPQPVRIVAGATRGFLRSLMVGLRNRRDSAMILGSGLKGGQGGNGLALGYFLLLLCHANGVVHLH